MEWYIILWLVGSIFSYFIFRYYVRKYNVFYSNKNRIENIFLGLLGTWLAFIIGILIVLSCAWDDWEEKKVNW